MKPRQLREEIETIDRRLRDLGPWETKLVAARKRYVLQGDRDVVELIEIGLRRGEGRPPDPDLTPFDQGWPGLHPTRETIAELTERRALLVEQLPSKAETAERKREAEARAKEIRARAEELTARIGPLEAALTEVARLALPLVEDTRRLWEDNEELDKVTADADIKRPETPGVAAPTIPAAALLGALLSGHFRGGRPYPPDPNVASQIRNALREPDPELAK